MQIVAEEVLKTFTSSSVQTPVERIQIIQGAALRSGTRIISGFLPAAALIPDLFEIPYYDTRDKSGYQRQPQEARINQLAGDLQKGRTDLPTAILLNLRTKDAKTALRDGYLDLAALRKLGLKFHVVDGQHRILALEKLLNGVTDPTSKWWTFALPFVCFVGADEEEEMNQFYIVNSTAKSVKTDLALALLKRRADADHGVMAALQERGRDWEVTGQGLVERLASESTMWKYRVRLPGNEKADTTISSASLVSSLKPLLTAPFFGGLKPTQQLRVLDAYWQAVRDVLRDAFDDPTNYSVQKGVGVIVLHHAMLYVLEVVRTRGLIPTEPESYRDILEPALTRLEGENADGNPVNGVDFWAAAPRGAAGSYSSSAGRRVLLAKIKQLLPSVVLD